jgi:uncharacterized protein (TIGR03086 family)
MTDDIRELFRRACDGFGDKVRETGDDQWRLPTPCTEWDVRALVNHLVSENRWIPPILRGKTIEEVGDRFDGDIVGQEPKATWDEAAEDAKASVFEDGAMQRTVHLSFGDHSGEDYISQVFCDLVIHGWDLARGIGADEAIDPELLDACDRIGTPMVMEWKTYGAFGPDVTPPPGAGRQTRLLAAYGRVA